MATVDAEKVKLAKTSLLEVLAACGGNTKDKTVIAAIDNLSKLNPIVAPAFSEELINSEWLLISAPNFPGGELLEDNKYAYTLGRLAFNMFQPTELKLVIDRVLQPVFFLGDDKQLRYDIVVEFTTIDESFPQVKGIVRNQGVCDSVSDKMLKVQFTGGVLAPHPSTNIKDWQAVFAKQSQSLQKSWKEKLMLGFLKLMFGLVPSQEMDSETGEVAFKMKRSPKGSLEILYLDRKLRITRGEKGTVLVCQSN